MTRITALLAAAGLVPVVVFNRAFVRLWMGDAFDYGGDFVTLAAALNAFSLAEQSLWAWCFTATGKTKMLVLPAVASAVINLASSLILTSHVGLPGPLLGTTIGFTTVGLWALPLLLRREFGTPIGPLAKAAGLPALFGIVMTAILWPLSSSFKSQGWAAFIGVEALGFIMILMLGVALLLPADERDEWIKRLRGVRGGIS